MHLKSPLSRYVIPQNRQQFLKKIIRPGGWLLGGTALFFIFLLLWQERKGIGTALSSLNTGWFLLALVISLIASLAYIAVWHFTARSLGGTGSYRATLFFLSVAGIARYLPGGIWAIAGMVWLNDRVRLLRRTIPVLAFTAQGLYLMSAMWVAFTGLLLTVTPKLLWFAVTGAFLTLALLAIIPLLFRRYIHPLFVRLKLTGSERTASYNSLYRVLYFSIAVWLLNGLKLFALTVSLIPLDRFTEPHYLLAYLLSAGALSGLASNLFFFIPLGLGAVELSLAGLLSLVIPDTSSLLSFLLINRLVQILNDLIFAGLAAPELKATGRR